MQIKTKRCTEVHYCHCGGAHAPHVVGNSGCFRRMAVAPRKLRHEGYWLIGKVKVTDFTLRQQWGYSQHPCGCWSTSGESSNSVGNV